MNKKVLNELEEIIDKSELLDTPGEVEEIAAIVYQKIAENMFIDDWGSGGSGQFETDVRQILFDINLNWHPEINVEPMWKRMTLTQYISEFRFDIDIINDMFKAGAIKLVSA